MKLISSVIMILAALSTACGAPAPPADEIAGRWESHSFVMTISRDGDGYLINLDNHRGMLSGDYSGERVDGAIRVTLPLAGEQLIRISENGDRLEFIGEQLARAQPGRTGERSERRQDAAQ